MELPIGAKKRGHKEPQNVRIATAFTAAEADKIDAYIKALAGQLPIGYRLSRHSFMRDVILREVNK